MRLTNNGNENAYQEIETFASLIYRALLVFDCKGIAFSQSIRFNIIA